MPRPNVIKITHIRATARNATRQEKGKLLARDSSSSSTSSSDHAQEETVLNVKNLIKSFEITPKVEQSKPMIRRSKSSVGFNRRIPKKNIISKVDVQDDSLYDKPQYEEEKQQEEEKPNIRKLVAMFEKGGQSDIAPRKTFVSKLSVDVVDKPEKKTSSSKIKINEIKEKAKKLLTKKSGNYTDAEWTHEAMELLKQVAEIDSGGDDDIQAKKKEVIQLVQQSRNSVASKSPENIEEDYPQPDVRKLKGLFEHSKNYVITKNLVNAENDTSSSSDSDSTTNDTEDPIEPVSNSVENEPKELSFNSVQKLKQNFENEGSNFVYIPFNERHKDLSDPKKYEHYESSSDEEDQSDKSSVDSQAEYFLETNTTNYSHQNISHYLNSRSNIKDGEEIQISVRERIALFRQNNHDFVVEDTKHLSLPEVQVDLTIRTSSESSGEYIDAKQDDEKIRETVTPKQKEPEKVETRKQENVKTESLSSTSSSDNENDKEKIISVTEIKRSFEEIIKSQEKQPEKVEVQQQKNVKTKSLSSSSSSGDESDKEKVISVTHIVVSASQKNVEETMTSQKKHPEKVEAQLQKNVKIESSSSSASSDDENDKEKIISVTEIKRSFEKIMTSQEKQPEKVEIQHQKNVKTKSLSSSSSSGDESDKEKVISVTHIEVSASQKNVEETMTSQKKHPEKVEAQLQENVKIESSSSSASSDDENDKEKINSITEIKRSLEKIMTSQENQPEKVEENVKTKSLLSCSSSDDENDKKNINSVTEIKRCLEEIITSQENQSIKVENQLQGNVKSDSLLSSSISVDENDKVKVVSVTKIELIVSQKNVEEIVTSQEKQPEKVEAREQENVKPESLSSSASSDDENGKKKVISVTEIELNASQENVEETMTSQEKQPEKEETEQQENVSSASSDDENDKEKVISVTENNIQKDKEEPIYDVPRPIKPKTSSYNLETGETTQNNNVSITENILEESRCKKVETKKLVDSSGSSSGSSSDSESSDEDKKLKVKISLEIIAEIMEELTHFKNAIFALAGEISNDTCNYFNEALIATLIKLDAVHTQNNKAVQNARRQALQLNQDCIKLLKSKLTTSSA